MEKIKQFLLHISLTAWFAGISIPLAYFHFWHTSALPDTKIVQEKIQSISEPGSWVVGHFLDERCPCSRAVISKLIERKVNSNVIEKIFLVNSTNENNPKLAAVGFSVFNISESDLQDKFSLDGLPAMSIIDSQKKIKYFGGYSEKNIHRFTKLKDQRILASLQNGQQVLAKPRFGCAISKKLQTKLDPLNLKYGDWKNE